MSEKFWFSCCKISRSAFAGEKTLSQFILFRRELKLSYFNYTQIGIIVLITDVAKFLLHFLCFMLFMVPYSFIQVIRRGWEASKKMETGFFSLDKLR